jgi:penicillin G amidase
LIVALLLLLAVILAYAGNVAIGLRVHARYDGTTSGLRVLAPVQILRDDRGVPHVIARNEHDLFFAQGYVEGSDRLFQMDTLRRFILGELAETYGPRALATDETQRAIPVRRIVMAQWRRLDPRSREILGAFSDGVNAAMTREPLPAEFRILGRRARPWTPQDSLAVSMATVLDLIDDWNAIAPRDAAYRRGGLRLLERRFPFTDPCYDAPVMQGLAGVAVGPLCRERVGLLDELAQTRAGIGSNEWAVGANHAVERRALLANDPHLGLRMPGVWYLIDLRAPHFHVAGAALPGLPSIVLGHNESLAWGATDGTVTSLSAFLPPARLNPSAWETERFAVRFSKAATKRYYRTAREFGLTTADGRFVLVHWSAYDDPVTPALAFLEVARAASIEDATRIFARFAGPTQNFVFADTRGRAAYFLAGQIPNDPVWSRWFHPASDLRRVYPSVPFAQLPKVAPSRDAILWTANNKIYGANYPLRLSPQFAPPYRAYRIAELLRAARRYDVSDFARMQMDALSLPERQLSHDLAGAVARRDVAMGRELGSWNGEMVGDSTTATVAQMLRMALTHRHTARMPTVLADAAHKPDMLAGVHFPSPAPWRMAGAVQVPHALAALGLTFLDGKELPGYGDAFTLHVQYPGVSQSFRAVWDVGNWDAGGITLPQGESGEIGSGHYTDQVQAWIEGRLWPLPFSDSAVQRTAVARQTLSP